MSINLPPLWGLLLHDEHGTLEEYESRRHLQEGDWRSTQRPPDTGIVVAADHAVTPAAMPSSPRKQRRANRRDKEGHQPSVTIWKGMGRRSRSSWTAVGPRALLLLLAILLTTCSGIAESCKLDGCWQLYQTAQTSLGLGDGFSASSRDDSTPSPQALRDRCIALRTYRRCIDNMTRCKGNLNYHTSHQVVQAKMRQFNCTISGPVFDGAAAPPGRGGPGGYRGGRGQARPQVCSYSGRKEHKHCGLFGDPHLRTFDDKFQTCKVQGAWPLLDNEYLTVQVTNDPVGVWEGTATATSKLTVVVKRNDECAADRFVTYQAQTDLLPAVFDDGRSEFGPEGAVRITEVEPGRHVQIYLRYIDTTLIIRQIGRFFTFAAKMPAEVISERRPSSYPSAASGELCVRGCPHGERINYKKFLARKHKRLKSGSKNVLQEQTTSDATMMMNRDLAETLCRKAQVVDFYFDSCVFDLMTTGDMNFTVAASQALRDVLRLMPQTARMHKNRTDLLEIDAEYTSSATSLRTQGAHRTETYSRICVRSLLLSLWTYTICLTLSQWASGTTTTV